jgi:hypothetical protein
MYLSLIIGSSPLLHWAMHTNPDFETARKPRTAIRNVQRLGEREMSGDIRSMVTTSSGHQLVFYVEFELFQPDFLEQLLIGRIRFLDKNL